MTDPGFSQALAKVVDRLMDRFLPELVPPRDLAEKLALWFSALIGTTFWGGALVLYLDSSSSEFVSPENFLTFMISCSMICLIFTLLIARSFDRGRPLMFFFWGLIFPTLSFRILKLAFPF